MVIGHRFDWREDSDGWLGCFVSRGGNIHAKRKNTGISSRKILTGQCPSNGTRENRCVGVY
ncbi:hypothetical protein FM101_13725 [Arthrobacter rhombi]|uniref:Uncharacterized protein n=1 Tax=Arthrobacter rhombi TaxID=71253 RepID=A0A1R4GTU1_9MICC|nr:hypothetical protein FM101_13725 [Arthrobacter rhombi]